MENIFCPKCTDAESVEPRRAALRQDHEIETVIADCLMDTQGLTSSGKTIHPNQL